jgi:hypothetical protein
MSLMKGMKGNNMRFQIFVLFLLFFAFTLNAATDDAMYLHLECMQGQDCIDLASSDNGVQSVTATPALVLKKLDFKSASIRSYDDTHQAIELELNREAADKFKQITGENIGKKLMVVFNNKILTAPTVREAIGGGKIQLDGQQVTFWQGIPWLQELIKESYETSGHSVMVYVIVALAVSISAFAFILLPRMKRSADRRN